MVSTAYLDYTYSILDFKICHEDSCLGFDSVQCQTCQSDNGEAEEGTQSSSGAAGDVHVSGMLKLKLLNAAAMHSIRQAFKLSHFLLHQPVWQNCIVTK